MAEVIEEKTLLEQVTVSLLRLQEFDVSVLPRVDHLGGSLNSQETSVSAAQISYPLVSFIFSLTFIFVFFEGPVWVARGLGFIKARSILKNFFRPLFKLFLQIFHYQFRIR